MCAAGVDGGWAGRDELQGSIAVHVRGGVAGQPVARGGVQSAKSQSLVGTSCRECVRVASEVK